MTRICLVEDDREIAKNLVLLLRSEGFAVTHAPTREEAFAAAEEHKFDLALIDIALPDGNGFTVYTKIKETQDIPVIFLTASGDETSVVTGLNMGADDYITKPFRPLVLGAKVKALIRRNKNMVLDHSDVLDCGPFTYNTSTMRFYKGEEEISLSSKENSLMLLFMKHPGQLFTKDMIYEHVWGTSVAVDDNAIIVYIHRLRGKIEEDRQKPEHIVTVRGLGYRFIP